MSLAIIFGTNLRNIRKAKRLTQAELAERASLSTEMISKIERGVAAPSFANIEKLSEILEVQKFSLFSGDILTLGDNDRAQMISRIQSKISRMNNDQLAKADRLLAVFFD